VYVKKTINKLPRRTISAPIFEVGAGCSSKSRSGAFKKPLKYEMEALGVDRALIERMVQNSTIIVAREFMLQVYTRRPMGSIARWQKKIIFYHLGKSV